MTWLLVLPFLAQGIGMAWDELYFHRRRGLPRWERVGHPLDTLTLLACFGLILLAPFSDRFLKVYLGMAVFSSLFITKDEFVHARRCPAGEHWLHAVLFVLHPLVLLIGLLVWPVFHPGGAPPFFALPDSAALLKSAFLFQSALAAGFFLYQIIYWNVLWKEPPNFGT